MTAAAPTPQRKQPPGKDKSTCAGQGKGMGNQKAPNNADKNNAKNTSNGQPASQSKLEDQLASPPERHCQKDSGVADLSSRSPHPVSPSLSATESDNNHRRIVMQAFVGTHLTTMTLSTRQRDAIQRLLKLNPLKFEMLVDDLIEEINRRSGLKPVREPVSAAVPDGSTAPGTATEDIKESIINHKLKNLSDVKFKNLIVDTLLVYNFRHPGACPLDMPAFLSRLQGLINELKEKAAQESFVRRLEGLPLVHAMAAFVQFVREHSTMSPTVLDAMDGFIRAEAARDTDRFIECLAFPQVVAERLAHAESGKRPSPEFQYYLKNLQNLLQAADAHVPDSSERVDTVGRREQILERANKCKNGSIGSTSTFNDATTAPEDGNESLGRIAPLLKNKNVSSPCAQKERDNVHISADSSILEEQLSGEDIVSPHVHTAKDAMKKTGTALSILIKPTSGSNLIKKEMLALIELLIANIPVPATPVVSYEEEARALLRSLNRIKEDLTGTTCVNIQRLKCEASLVITSLLRSVDLSRHDAPHSPQTSQNAWALPPDQLLKGCYQNKNDDNRKDHSHTSQIETQCAQQSPSSQIDNNWHPHKEPNSPPLTDTHSTLLKPPQTTSLTSPHQNLTIPQDQVYDLLSIKTALENISDAQSRMDIFQLILDLADILCRAIPSSDPST